MDLPTKGRMMEKIKTVFCPKVFVSCKSKQDFIDVYKKLSEENKSYIVDLESYEIPKTGLVIYLSETLMTWGKVVTCANTMTKRNNLRSNGYTELSVDQALSHPGAITGSGRSACIG